MWQEVRVWGPQRVFAHSTTQLVDFFLKTMATTELVTEIMKYIFNDFRRPLFGPFQHMTYDSCVMVNYNNLIFRGLFFCEETLHILISWHISCPLVH